MFGLFRKPVPTSTVNIWVKELNLNADVDAIEISIPSGEFLNLKFDGLKLFIQRERQSRHHPDAAIERIYTKSNNRTDACDPGDKVPKEGDFGFASGAPYYYSVINVGVKEVSSSGKI